MNIFQKISSLDILDDKKLKPLYEKINGERLIDLLLFVPEYYNFSYKTNDWSIISSEDEVVIPFEITNHISFLPSVRNKSFGRQPYSIMGKSLSGQDIKITFFQIYRNYIEKLKTGLRIQISGRLKQDSFCYQIIHPKIISYEKIDDFILLKKRRIIENLNQKTFINKVIDNETKKSQLEISSIEPIYSKIKTIENCQIIDLLRKSIDVLEKDEDFLKNLELSDYLKSLKIKESIEKIHNPKTKEDVENISDYINNLSKLELLNIGLINKQMKVLNIKNHKISPSFLIRNKIIENLPFKLSSSQVEICEKITKIQTSELSSLSVLQGDVGSGKTVVALISCLNAIESGKNCIFLVPTVILANQHLKTLRNFCKDLINIQIITGETSVKEKKEIMSDFCHKKIDILISSHAIIYQKNFDFTKTLGLVIIDEQHKFGVKQRFDLISKVKNIDILMISATPIPRTLSMIKYGYVNILKLEHDLNREKNTTTSIISDMRIDEILCRIKEYSNKRINKTYWITPAIIDNENSEISSIESTEKIILTRFSKKELEVLHGKMKEKEKNQVLNNFINDSEKKILLSTTIIEVGVDISNANIIIIENSDRFGLAQLHQLRGRVGRQGDKSFCILVYKSKNISEKALERLNFLKNNTDGFKISEYDLQTRGAGSFFSEEQTGSVEFKINNRVVNIENNYKISEIESERENLIKSEKVINFLKEIFINTHTEDLFYI